MANVLTGKPSVDRPWMKYYPKEVSMLQVPPCTLGQYMMGVCPGMDVVAIDYYDTKITWGEMMGEVEPIAKALKAIGFKEGDQIPVFLRNVPEFYPLLLATEKIGASLVCRDNTLEENVEAVVKAGAKVIFAHDFLLQTEADAYIAAGVEKIVLLNPIRKANKESMPTYAQAFLDSLYTGPAACGEHTMSWDEFIAQGANYTGEVDAPIDPKRPVFRAYTSGSTGPSKQVIHSSENMVGVLCQMPMSNVAPSGERMTWLTVHLPPALIAVVLSFTLLPIVSNILLILDPFADVYDLDLEVMRLKPNAVPQIPMFTEVLMTSKRIPADYDLSFFVTGGVGAEWFSNDQSRRALKFFRSHNSPNNCTVGYGQTEAGGSCTIPAHLRDYPLQLNGDVGVPMPLCTMGIFKFGTDEELGYNQLGEVCKFGPGTMLGYDSKEATEKALVKHSDGNVWLHTGDIGYVNEDGVFFVLNRGSMERFGGGQLVGLIMENLVGDAQIEGVKDEFFVIAPDHEHEGYFLPYLYVVLEEGYTPDSIRAAVDAALEPHQRPIEIRAIDRRPFFHFKTARLALSNGIRAEKLLSQSVPSHA